MLSYHDLLDCDLSTQTLHLPDRNDTICTGVSLGLNMLATSNVRIRYAKHESNDRERIRPMIIVDTHCHAGLNKI